ncbi:uncharacterized protein LOC128198925 [Bicyclus anynana]|uniref:Uncharacterized protein LOC128198925 n=1 Tax=Bicyclus anynana TaxID=110368 RepID=A0ABM3LU99_BICAN|nr:uncharacterized protein LOC128198925 [Bicyclus anynana]
MSLKEPNSRLTRWRLKLTEYDFEVVYKQGKYNTNADALSRIQLNVEEISSIAVNPSIRSDDSRTLTASEGTDDSRTITVHTDAENPILESTPLSNRFTLKIPLLLDKNWPHAIRVTKSLPIYRYTFTLRKAEDPLLSPDLKECLKIINCYRAHLILLLLLPVTVWTQEVKLENLDEGPGVLPFKLGPTRIISHYHSFIQSINLQDIETKVNSVINQLDAIEPVLSNKTNSLFSPHIQYLTNKAYSVLEQLQSFEIHRTKRGLVDGLGSIVKSITGNLDQTDALHYNQAIKDLKSSENQLVTELNNQVSISKEWMTQYSNIIDNITKNQVKIEQLIYKISQADATRDYNLVKYAHLAQTFLIIDDNVDAISQEILRLQNVLAFIKVSTLHHSIIQRKSLNNIFSKLRSLYNSDNIIEVDIREYYEIIRVGYYYKDNKIIIVLKFPIVLPQIYTLFRLSMIPNKFNEILISPSPFLAIYDKEFRYIEAECPKTSKWYISYENSGMQNRDTEDCIHQLITEQQKLTTCKAARVTIHRPAYDELDEKHYTMHFPTPSKVRVSCGQDLFKELKGSYLATIPKSCSITTSDFVISNMNDHIEGQVLKIMDITSEESPQLQSPTSIELNTINLNHLHEINTKVSAQHPINIKLEATESSIYHTTIPLYLIIVGIGVSFIAFLIYKKYWRIQESIKEAPTEIVVPEVRTRFDPDQPPASFTSKVFRRCSTGGGVTRGNPAAST